MNKVNIEDAQFVVIQNKNDVYDWCEFKVSEASTDRIIKRMKL